MDLTTPASKATTDPTRLNRPAFVGGSKNPRVIHFRGIGPRPPATLGRLPHRRSRRLRSWVDMSTGTLLTGFRQNMGSWSHSIARPIEIPTDSQYRFHVDHFAPVAGTRSVRRASSPPSPARSVRSILAKMPLSKSITATCDLHMCTSGNLLHVRVCFWNPGAFWRRWGQCHGCSPDRCCGGWRSCGSDPVLGLLDRGTALAYWRLLAAKCLPVVGS